MDWQCSGCGRHFSFMQNECPYCKFVFTVTTCGTQPTDVQQANAAIALAERYRLPFSSESVIGKVMDGFLVWLQEQQQ